MVFGDFLGLNCSDPFYFGPGAPGNTSHPAPYRFFCCCIFMVFIVFDMFFIVFYKVVIVF